MADSPEGSSQASDESPAQRQARMRRERRQQKVTSGGKDRLQAIASLSGRTVQQMDEGTVSPLVTSTQIPRKMDLN
jgi:GET complex subunit GET2